MVNIAAPDKAKIIGFSVDKMGLLKVRVISAERNHDKDNYMDKTQGTGLSSSIIVKDISAPTGYQYNVYSTVSDKAQSSLDINYLGGKGTPGKFNVQSSNLLSL
jgi:hypothetical protein